jgi:hypothetical protein
MESHSESEETNRAQQQPNSSGMQLC